MRNFTSTTSHFNLSILAFLFLFLSSCYEKKEACLDIRATNLDLDGDIACEDCCEYPKLKFEFKNRAISPTDTSIIGFSGMVFDYTQDSFYLDVNDAPFRIKSIQYYVSNIRLIATDGTEAQINEEIDIQQVAGIETYKDDFLRINARSSSTLSAGSFSTINTYDGVKFSIGMDTEINSALPANMPTGHVLAVGTDSTLYDFENSQYLMGNIEIYKDTMEIDSFFNEIPIPLAGNGPLEVQLLFPESVILPEGFHFKITLLINCPAWFSTADITLDSLQIAEKIVSEMSNSISLLEVTVEHD